MTTNCACPRCGSDNVQSVPVIVMTGTRLDDIETRGGRAGEKAEVVHETRFVQTDLARALAAPTRPSMSVLAVFLANHRSAYKGAQAAWEKDFDEWQRSFFCFRCGHRFPINFDKSGPVVRG